MNKEILRMAKHLKSKNMLKEAYYLEVLVAANKKDNIESEKELDTNDKAFNQISKSS